MHLSGDTGETNRRWGGRTTGGEKKAAREAGCQIREDAFPVVKSVI